MSGYTNSMDAITLQQEIDKLRVMPQFQGASDEQLKSLLLGQTDVYSQDANSEALGLFEQNDNPVSLSQEAVGTNMDWNNPYEYQGPTNVMEDAQPAIGTGQQLYKGAQTIFGKEKVADFTGKIKNMFAPSVPMLKGATMTKAATFANVSNPAMMSSAGGTGALAGLGPLAAAAAGVYLWNKSKKKKKEAARKKREEQYKDFRETEREKLREGQEDYFSMASKYSNPYNVS